MLRIVPNKSLLNDSINGSFLNSQRKRQGSQANTKPGENNTGKREEAPSVLE